MRFLVPPMLGRTDLGKEMTFNLAGDTFSFPRNGVHSAWKCCHALVSKDVLQGTPKGSAKKRREAMGHALMENPLAFRLSLMKGDKSAEIGFYVVAAPYRSQKLNEQAVTLN